MAAAGKACRVAGYSEPPEQDTPRVGIPRAFASYNALRNGADSIEHGTYLDADSIRLMKASGR